MGTFTDLTTKGIPVRLSIWTYDTNKYIAYLTSSLYKRNYRFYVLQLYPFGVVQQGRTIFDTNPCMALLLSLVTWSM